MSDGDLVFPLFEVNEGARGSSGIRNFFVPRNADFGTRDLFFPMHDKYREKGFLFFQLKEDLGGFSFYNLDFLDHVVIADRFFKIGLVLDSAVEIAEIIPGRDVLEIGLLSDHPSYPS